MTSPGPQPTDADRDTANRYSAGLLDGQRLVIATYEKVAELIEADAAPGLLGDALDAWNAATMRAANLIRAVVYADCSTQPWIGSDHRCGYRAAAADRKLYADEFHARYRETAAELERTRDAVLAIHKAVPTWTDSTYDEHGVRVEQNALYDDDGNLVYAPNYRMHCQNCRVDTEWPCPTARAVGMTA